MRVLTLTIRIDEQIDADKYVEALEAQMASDCIYGDCEITLISYVVGNIEETD